MKGQKIMTGLSDISPKYIHEAEFGKLSVAKQTQKPLRRVFVFAAAACMLMVLAVSAYAANLFGIRELFQTQFRNLPEAADSYIQEENVTAAAEGWSCEITESLADQATVMATVAVHGGDKYIIAPTDAGPDDSVGVIGIPGDKTLGDYASEQGKSLLFVGASIKKVGQTEGITGSQRMESIADNEMVILAICEQTVDTSDPNAVCVVYALEDGKNEVKRVELPFTLHTAPVIGGETIYHPVKPDVVPGMTVGNLTVTESALGIQVELPETVTDEAKRNEIMKVELEGLEYAEGGSVLREDGNWYFEAKMCQGAVGDSITIRYYDWNNQLIGAIEFCK